MTRTSLELGGKSASIVLDDADLERAVRSSVGNAFLNSGQTCSAWTRLVVPRALQARVIEIAVASVERLRLGHPLEETTRLGPLVSAAQQRSVRAHIDRGAAIAELGAGQVEVALARAFLGEAEAVAQLELGAEEVGLEPVDYSFGMAPARRVAASGPAIWAPGPSTLR